MGAERERERERARVRGGLPLPPHTGGGEGGRPGWLVAHLCEELEAAEAAQRTCANSAKKGAGRERNLRGRRASQHLQRLCHLQSSAPLSKRKDGLHTPHLLLATLLLRHHERGKGDEERDGGEERGRDLMVRPKSTGMRRAKQACAGLDPSSSPWVRQSQTSCSASGPAAS